MGAKMIYSNRTITSELVGQHYDDLDSLYRQIWGEHLHHGFFLTGQESIEEATLLLSEEVARLSALRPLDRVCDIGCGYGKTSQLFAEKYKAQVLGITISQRQLAFAKKHEQIPHLQFRLMDWLENDFPDESFDHLISIESSEHMPNKERFFSQAHRVLKTHGTFVICAWLSAENPSRFENRHFLEPICHEGRLPSLGTEAEYRILFSQNGLTVKSFADLSHSVKKTWTLSMKGLARHMVTHPRDLKFLLRKFNENAEFLKSLLRIRLAYETGAMRYGIFSAVKV